MSAQAHTVLAKVLFLKADYTASANHFQRAIELGATEDETVYFQLSKALQQLGRTDEAAKNRSIYEELIAKKSALEQQRIQGYSENEEKHKKH